jgi:hypothetical protein
VDYHSSPFEGGTTFEGTCKPNTVAKIKMKVGLPISLADFGTRIQKYFKLSIALALQIGVSNVAITEVKDTTTITSLDNRRRLLQEDDESWSIEVTTTTTVPSANVNSTIAFFSQQRVISELQLSTGIVSSYVSTPEVTHISTRHTTLMKSEKRLISFISACPCVQSQWNFVRQMGGQHVYTSSGHQHIFFVNLSPTSNHPSTALRHLPALLRGIW